MAITSVYDSSSLSISLLSLHPASLSCAAARFLSPLGLGLEFILSLSPSIHWPSILYPSMRFLCPLGLGFQSLEFFSSPQCAYGRRATAKEPVLVLESLQSWGLWHGCSLFSIGPCLLLKLVYKVLLFFFLVICIGYVELCFFLFSSITFEWIFIFFYFFGLYCSLWWTFNYHNKMMILIIMGIVVRMRAGVAKVGTLFLNSFLNGFPNFSLE